MEAWSLISGGIIQVKIEIPMHKSVLNCSLTPSQGKYSFDPVSKVLSWEVGKIDQTKLPNLRGTVNLVTGAAPEDTNPSIRYLKHHVFTNCHITRFSLQFSISQLGVSGLKVNRLDMYGEKYKPFKGVKYLTKAGRFQVRM